MPQRRVWPLTLEDVLNIWGHTFIEQQMWGVPTIMVLNLGSLDLLFLQDIPENLSEQRKRGRQSLYVSLHFRALVPT